MTSALAAIGLTYDGEDLQHSDLGIFLQITVGLNEKADVRGKDVIVPANEGRDSRQRRADVLRIVLSGHCMGNGADQAAARTDFRQSSRLLRDLFDPVRLPADLVATLEDGATATISARPLPEALWNEVVQSEFAYVVYPLESLDAEWVFSDQGS